MNLPHAEPLTPAEAELASMAMEQYDRGLAQLEAAKQRRLIAIALSHSVVEGEDWAIRQDGGRWFLDRATQGMADALPDAKRGRLARLEGERASA